MEKISNQFQHSSQNGVIQEQIHQEQTEVQQKFYKRLDKFYSSFYLTSLQRVAMTKFIKTHFSNQNQTRVQRIKPWFFSKLNEVFIKSENQMQRGCPDIIPGLRAQPWWDQSEFPWIKHFEENYLQIRQELLSLKSQTGFQPYLVPSWIYKSKEEDKLNQEAVTKGAWNIFYLQLHNINFDKNCEKAPFTMGLIQKYIPNNYHHCFFSGLVPNSHIKKHYGSTNKKLRLHLPLVGVKGSRLRVGNITKQQQEGKAYIFDDSFEHEAWHDGDEARIILIIDFWHPDLSEIELKFLKVLQGAIFKAERIISEEDKSQDNFYSIIENAKQSIKENDWWVTKSQNNQPNIHHQEDFKDPPSKE